MTFVLFGLAALLQVPNPATPPDWRIVADGSNGSQLSTDVTRASCKGMVCTSTELTEYLKPLPAGASKAVDDVQYDCAQLTTRTLSETSFDVRGRQIGHVGTPTAWIAVAPNSIGFQAMAYACTARQAALAVSTAGVPQTSAQAHDVERAADKHVGAASAQIASSLTADGAQSALAALEKVHSGPAGLANRVEQAVVRGHATYRALITGFASQADAAAFCQEVKSESGCLVRAEKTNH